MVSSKTTAEIRRENLRLLMKQHHGPKNFAAVLGYKNGSFLVQMAGPNPTRPVTENTARTIEEKLGFPPGTMDEPMAAADPPRHNVVVRSAGQLASPVAPVVGADMPLVADVVRLVGQVAEAEKVALPPVKYADLVALAWSDAMEHSGKAREDYVKQLIKLVK